MTEQAYGSHTMTEANFITSGKLNQSSFKNNLTRRNMQILESTHLFHIRNAPKKHLHFFSLRQS